MALLHTVVEEQTVVKAATGRYPTCMLAADNTRSLLLGGTGIRLKPR